MSLIVPVPPDGAIAAVRTALEQAGAPLTEGIASVRTLTASDQPPVAFAVYVLGANDLLAGDGRVAHFVGWQHFVMHADSGRVAAAETIPVDYADHVVGRVCDEPPFLAETLAAKTLATNNADDGEYELRLMVVPAVYALAVWLMNTVESGGDKFIVVNAGELFEPGALVYADTWYAALRSGTRRVQR
jgi:hypothetical protein